MSGDNRMFEDVSNEEKKKGMSCGLEVECPGCVKDAIHNAWAEGYHFIVTHLVHPRYARNLLAPNAPRVISRTDRILSANEWNRAIVGKLSPNIDVDNEVDHIMEKSEAILSQELEFASHLGVPAIMLPLTKKNNINLSRIMYNKLLNNSFYTVWVTVPMVHPSRFSKLCSDKEEEDTWEWWNNLRIHCDYNKRLAVVLELSDNKHIPSSEEIDRWVGEPVKALVISTSLFLTNQHQQPVLSKIHQDIIQKFLNLNVQYIITGANLHGHCYKLYNKYMEFLGKKLFKNDALTEFVQGCEDYLQNPLQPLTEHLESSIYDTFERDHVKYVEYQNAIQKALEDIPSSVESPVIMVLGAGRGPLVQATLNASYILQRKIKVYAVEKNPFAINTLEDRVKNEWHGEVTLVHEDMRFYEPPEKADIIVSELLGSFGDNELSPECLEGAQKFLKKTGISIPASYTSFLAPIQSTKIYNEIRNSRPHDKSLNSCFEMPYVVHLVNYYQIATSQALFKFEHPNWKTVSNKRFAKLKFHATQNCVLTAFAGYFEAVLYKDITLSINPQTHTKNMVSWFPIVFPLPEPINIYIDNVIEVAFWRCESKEKVWYQWCLECPLKSSIMNPNGRSFFIKKH